MNKRIFSVVLALVLVVAGFSVAGAQDTEVKNPNTMTMVTIGDQNTMDPHFAYDTASSEVIFNVMEALIAYDRSSIEDFKPMLSTKVPSLDNGLISEDGTEYTFVLREGVEFSNGNELTPEDVKYSFMRGMVQDRTGGPVWMLIEPFFGVQTLDAAAKKVLDNPGEDFKIENMTDEQAEKLYEAMDEKIVIDGNEITLKLDAPYPPFLTIVAHGNNVGMIMDKEWVVEQGGWDGTPETIVEHHDPNKENDPLFDKLMGTGPFILEEWQNGDHVILRRNDDYWREPANFETAVIQNVDEWSTRKMMFLRGDADLAYVPKQYRSQVMETGKVDIVENLPQLQNTTMMFNWDINIQASDFVGSGKLDGNGIPADFFADVHVRRAFSHAFNYDAFIKEVRMGEAIRLRGPIVKPLQGYDENSEVPKLNLEKAEEEFKKAFDGELWEKGFEMTLVYNTGNSARKVAADMLKSYIEQINPKFDVKVQGLQWSTYLDGSIQGTLPASFGGWLADFPDAHNFAQPFLHSEGYYGGQRGENYMEWAEESGLNDLIDKGITTVDPEKRKEVYKEIQEIAVDQAIDIWLDQAIGVHLERKYLEGYYPNPMRPGTYFYMYNKPGGYETHEVKGIEEVQN